jgi:diguanylate cyclase (GGDEF)-like protein
MTVPVDVAVHRLRAEGEELRAVVLRDVSAQRRSEDELQRLNEELRARVGELARLNRENELLGNFGAFLQACQDVGDVSQVLQRFLPEIFERSRGTYSAMRGRLLEQELSWGNGSGAGVFMPDDCWGLRRGETHVLRGPRDLRCGHLHGVADCPDHDSLCVPVMTGDGPVGLLHVQLPAARSDDALRSTQRMLSAVCDRLGAALTNLRLRDRLREESIRDPLTRLFNRRYMVETMQRELVRAKRASLPLAVVMLDVDHFKSLNDRYGHDVGDQVLQAVSSELSAAVRTEDVVCRYGGEEFVAILPGATLELATSRAEELRSRLHGLRLQARGAAVSGVTVSAGVAVASRDATPESLLRAADRALLQAKQAGRDRVCVSFEDGRVVEAA